MDVEQIRSGTMVGYYCKGGAAVGSANFCSVFDEAGPNSYILVRGESAWDIVDTDASWPSIALNSYVSNLISGQTGFVKLRNSAGAVIRSVAGPTINAYVSFDVTYLPTPDKLVLLYSTAAGVML